MHTHTETDIYIYVHIYTYKKYIHRRKKIQRLSFQVWNASTLDTSHYCMKITWLVENDKSSVKMVIAISYSYVDSPLFLHL